MSHRQLLAHSLVGLLCLVGCSKPSEVTEGVNKSAASSATQRTDDNALGRDEDPRRHALLIGCSQYKYLEDWAQLDGPTNDVALFRQLLTERFEFDPKKDEIVTLTDEQSASHQPTRDNIEREFLRLGKTVSPGEFVVILLGGHGSQQPDDDPRNPRDVEPDGLDELFLPSDAKKWNVETGEVDNAIVDDEFRVWLSKIIDRGAFVWLIMDSCHSGSGVRGSGAEVSRHIPPEALVPKELLVDANLNEDSRADSAHFAGTSAGTSAGGIAAIYAAQPHETTPERKLPLDADASAREYYGLLTYTICKILSNTRRNLTYRELVQAIQTRYVVMGRRSPTPMLEGSHPNQLVLGRDSLPERSRIQLIEDGKRFKINAGSLHGLSKDSILAVFPPTGFSADPDPRPLGYVRIISQDLATAHVEPCAYQQMSINGSLPDRGRCEVVYRSAGELRLTVAVDPRDTAGEWISTELRDQISHDLSSQDSAMIKVIDEPSEADWLARWENGSIQLVPSTGISRADTESHRRMLAPLPMRGTWSKEAIADLTRVARAQNLLRVTTDASEPKQEDLLGFELSLLDGKTKRPVRWSNSGLTLYDGDLITIKLNNHGSGSLDVTLLYIDSEFGIQSLYPDPLTGESNRLFANDEVVFDIRVNATTTGIENLVAIAVRGNEQPTDFSVLAQPSLTGARDAAQRRALLTPLGQLLRTAMYGAVDSRGKVRDRRKEPDAYVITSLTWTIES